MVIFVLVRVNCIHVLRRYSCLFMLHVDIYSLPEVIVRKAIYIALFKGSLILIAVAYRVISSGYGIDAAIGKCLPVKCHNIAQS